MLEILSWIAVVILSGSYFAQVWRIHVHKEVRDLSLPAYIGLSIGFLILLIQAISENSTIFIVKQLTTFIPCFIIVIQIIIHREDKWRD